MPTVVIPPDVAQKIFVEFCNSKKILGKRLTIAEFELIGDYTDYISKQTVSHGSMI